MQHPDTDMKAFKPIDEATFQSPHQSTVQSSILQSSVNASELNTSFNNFRLNQGADS